MRLTITVLACAALAACSPAVPDSGYQGVGFEDYDAYQRERLAREAELTGSALPSPTAVSSEPLSALRPTGEAESVAADAQAALARTAPGTDTAAADTAAASEPPQTVATATGISAENDFDAVGAERSIEDDAALIARNRAQYEVIEPTALPTRSGSGGPNIVDFALSTDHLPGTRVYDRSSFNGEARYLRNCAKYASADQAQLEFLDRGGPRRDRLGLDPDGDGFACGWDPRPFRAAVATDGGA